MIVWALLRSMKIHNYGAQTARSLHYFSIGTETLSSNFIKHYATLKHAAAKTNHSFEKLSKSNQSLICQAAEEIMHDKLLDQFPVRVWQTGSGTQTNMNVNEVIANRANEIAGQPKGSKSPVHQMTMLTYHNPPMIASQRSCT